jgi:prolyl-tRNA synthetase
VSQSEARQYALRILEEVYRSTMVDVLAMPVLVGHKTPRERFAGAIETWTCEGMMGDGKALQMGTSHELGQNFAVPFNITYTNTTGTTEHVWQTSWGVSTRLVGALVMGHGDDFGLRLPPALAPIQVVVLVVKDSPEVSAAAAALAADLAAAGHRVRLDDRTDTGFGRRSVAWELKGVPVRIEVGPRDLAEGNVTVVLRHRREKENVALGAVAGVVDRMLSTVASDLLAEATAIREARTVEVATLEEAIEAGSVGFARIPVAALGPDGEDRLATHAITVRCLQRADGSLAASGDPADSLVAVVARSY